MELIDAGDSLTAGDRVAKETGFLNKSGGFDAKLIAETRFLILGRSHGWIASIY
ncbi:MAG: hypothetical protein GDA56_21660 [Hormoscilla sp. GM7CHS1pb]|nr:hypothetical protein [Hormoscilla sp. GM7CHS1pb]